MKKSRSELFDLLAELHNRYPEWRFGQLVSNLAGWADQDIWDVEDNALIEAAKEHLGSSPIGASETKAKV